MLALIGLPGSGKSTVGNLLARHYDLPFVDLDKEIEIALGCSIAQCFEERGELYFRDLESELLDQITKSGRCVLSTGGGTVLRASNREWLRMRAKVIYLASTPQELLPRLKNDTKRPLLQVHDLTSRLTELYETRDPLYKATAEIILHTGAGPAKRVISEYLKLHPNFYG